MQFAWAGIAAAVGCDYSNLKGKGLASVLPVALSHAAQGKSVADLVRSLTTSKDLRQHVAMGALCFLLHCVRCQSGDMKTFCSNTEPSVLQLRALAEGHAWLAPVLEATTPSGVQVGYMHTGCEPCFDTYPAVQDTARFDRTLLDARPTSAAGWSSVRPGDEQPLPRLHLGTISLKYQAATSILDGGFQRALELREDNATPLHVKRVKGVHDSLIIFCDVPRSYHKTTVRPAARLTLDTRNEVFRVAEACCDPECTIQDALQCRYAVRRLQHWQTHFH